MVDDEPRVGMAVDQRRACVQIVPAQDVEWKIVANGRARNPVEAGIVSRALLLLPQHDADSNRARRLLPFRDDFGHAGIVWVERLDDGEPAGMGPLHLHGIAGIVAVQRKGRDEDRAIDADLVHRRHHLVTRDVIGPVRHAMPGPLRAVRLIGMDLGIDNRHRSLRCFASDFGQYGRCVSRWYGRCAAMRVAVRCMDQRPWGGLAQRNPPSCLRRSGGLRLPPSLFELRRTSRLIRPMRSRQRIISPPEGMRHSEGAEVSTPIPLQAKPAEDRRALPCPPSRQL